MRTNQLIFILIAFGALTFVGLRFFANQDLSVSTSQAAIKPSQIDFTQSNKISEPKTVKLQSNAEQIAAVQKPVEFKSEIEQRFSAFEKKQWAAFNTILKSKNDNDPRLDSDLKKLSQTLSQALMQKYDSLPHEDRGGRGLITFLIARNFATADEADFLKKVFAETPCLSLGNCQTTSEQNPHNSGVDSTTLIYPQQSVLYMIEKQLAENPKRLDNTDYRAGVTQIITQAENYPIASVRDKAKSIKQKFGI